MRLEKHTVVFESRSKMVVMKEITCKDLIHPFHIYQIVRFMGETKELQRNYTITHVSQLHLLLINDLSAIDVGVRVSTALKKRITHVVSLFENLQTV